MSNLDLNQTLKYYLQNITYKKLLSLKLCCYLLALYLHQTLAKGFKIIQYVKILKFGGDWDKLQAKCFSTDNRGKIFDKK